MMDKLELLGKMFSSLIDLANRPRRVFYPTDKDSKIEKTEQYGDGDFTYVFKEPFRSVNDEELKKMLEE